MNLLDRSNANRIIPSQAVLHPAWLAAVGVLVLNDHVLKSSAVAGVLTGKLSDFAGLFFFPVLLAALFRVRTTRGLVLSGVATAVVFSAINLSHAAATQFDALMSMFVGFHTTVDPTDLIALVAIPAGLMFFAPMMRAASSPTRVKQRLQLCALIAGGAASIATSPPPCEGVECEESQLTYVSLLNRTNELHELRVSMLRPEITFDCDVVREQPNDLLNDGVFGEPRTWLLQSGQEATFEFNEPAKCTAALVESDTVPDILVFYDEAEMSLKYVYFDVDVPQEITPDRQTVVLEADYSDVAAAEMHTWRERSSCGQRADLCDPRVIEPLARIPNGAQYSWTSQYSTALHHLRSERDTAAPDHPAQCVTSNRAALEWGQPFADELSLTGFEPGPDGCHTLQLAEESTVRSWSVCAPVEALARLSEAGTDATVSVTPHRDDSYEALEIAVIERTPEVRRYTIWLTRGSELPNAIDFEPLVVPADECSLEEAACGQLARVGKLESVRFDFSLNAGESSHGDALPFEVYLAYAQQYAVVDLACAANTASIHPETLSYFEAVVVRDD